MTVLLNDFVTVGGAIIDTDAAPDVIGLTLDVKVNGSFVCSPLAVGFPFTVTV